MSKCSNPVNGEVYSIQHYVISLSCGAKYHKPNLLKKMYTSRIQLLNNFELPRHVLNFYCKLKIKKIYISVINFDFININNIKNVLKSIYMTRNIPDNIQILNNF